jgi:hypothetical protein
MWMRTVSSTARSRAAILSVRLSQQHSRRWNFDNVLFCDQVPVTASPLNRIASHSTFEKLGAWANTRLGYTLTLKEIQLR